jgi:hypothetical protein
MFVGHPMHPKTKTGPALRFSVETRCSRSGHGQGPERLRLVKSVAAIEHTFEDFMGQVPPSGG